MSLSCIHTIYCSHKGNYCCIIYSYERGYYRQNRSIKISYTPTLYVNNEFSYWSFQFKRVKTFHIAVVKTKDITNLKMTDIKAIKNVTGDLIYLDLSIADAVYIKQKVFIYAGSRHNP
jgi:hypothetical protein